MCQVQILSLTKLSLFLKQKSSPILVLIACAGFWGSLYAPWIRFPVAPALDARHIELLPLCSLALCGQAVLLGVVLSGLTGYFRWRFYLLSLLFSGLLALPFLWVAHNPDDWLCQYQTQTLQKIAWSDFVQEQFIPNLNPEPLFIPVTEWSSPGQQLYTQFAMLGWGWYLALASIGSAGFMIWRYDRPINNRHGLRVVIGLCLPACVLFSGLLRADAERRAGDEALWQGHWQYAHQYYQKAWTHNPALSCTIPFLLKWAQTSRSDQAILPLWMEIRQMRLLDTKKPVALSRYQTFLARWRSVQAAQQGLQRQAHWRHVLSIRLWNQYGLAAWRQQDWQTALYAWQKSLALDDQVLVRFYLATLYLRLDAPQAVLPLLQPALKKTGNLSLRADIACTIGDAWERMGNMDKARQAYWQCRQLDNLKNYRILHELGGF